MMEQLKELTETMKEISVKLDDLLEIKKNVAAEIAINSYMGLASTIITPVEQENGETVYGVDEAAVDRMYIGLQENFYKLQEKIEAEEKPGEE
jgi:hypothetical protein